MHRVTVMQPLKMKSGIILILIGKEGESWTSLKEEAFPKLLDGSFDEVYQAMLIAEFEKNLGV